MCSNLSKQIKVTLNGKVYNLKTTNGFVDFKLPRLRSGVYTLNVIFDSDCGYKSSFSTSKVTVKKQKSSLNIKKYLKKKLIKITLKNQFKKVLSKKTIKLTINKKTYKLKTNKKGIATFKVKLKNNKNYKFTAKFNSDNYYKSVLKKSSFKI